MFDANPQWRADCVRRVEVRFEEEGGETVWEQSISNDDGCENKFPITYGKPLRGRRHVYSSGGVPDVMIGTPAHSVRAKRLGAGAIYTVSTTTGATGYGCDRFRIKADLQVENLGCT